MQTHVAMNNFSADQHTYAQMEKHVSSNQTAVFKMQLKAQISVPVHTPTHKQAHVPLCELLAHYLRSRQR